MPLTKSVQTIQRYEYVFETVGDLEYKFYPVIGDLIEFEVKASNDAHIAFTSDPQDFEPVTEVIIGGWNNTKSIIEKNYTTKTENETKHILNDHEFRGFWVQLNNGNISVGCKGDSNAFLSWTDPEPFPLKFMGFSIASGAMMGSWQVVGLFEYALVPTCQYRRRLDTEQKEPSRSSCEYVPTVKKLLSSGSIIKLYGGSDELPKNITKYIDVETENCLQYKFYPATVPLKEFLFEVKAPHDAHIALTSDIRATEPIIEIIIGGWGNTKSVIRRNQTKPEKAENTTNDILNGDEYRGFWVRWNDGTISVGCKGENNAFLYWNDPEPFSIYYVGLCTGWGATGSWKIRVPESYGTWVDAKLGEAPDDAVVGGQDITLERIFVARARHNDGTLPGKLITSHGCALVPSRKKEHIKPEYQVLVGGPNNWVSVKGSKIPSNAFIGGKSEDGEPLFIGRVAHRGSVTTGMVQKSHGLCYISFGGQELAFTDYEVLTH